MKVLLQKNIDKLGHIGEVVEVKPGYARNYLIPQGLAVQPTQANVRATEVAKHKYLEELAKLRSELEAKAQLVDGREITIAARANEEGHLYGSIGPAQIVAALAAGNVFVESEHVVLESPIRQLDKYEVPLKFAEGVTATLNVWVVPVSGEGPDAEAQGEGNDGDVSADETSSDEAPAE